MSSLRRQAVSRVRAGGRCDRLRSVAGRPRGRRREGGSSIDAPEATVETVGRLEDRDGFYVEDDGEGVPDTDADLFEPGTTTKGESRGFGLSNVREIATAHGWTVEATTGTDGGARIEFAGVGWAGDRE